VRVTGGGPGPTRERARVQLGRARDDVIVRSRMLGSAPRPLPEFVVLGAQKAGTSTLYAGLAAHPQVVPALRKEVHAFDTGPVDARRYRANFPTLAARAAVERATGLPAITGEATPFYLFHPLAPARAHAVIPDALLVVVLRDPVARAVSGYHHAVRFGDERRPIELALDPGREEPLAPPDDARSYDSRRSAARRRGYLARGRYAEQLERWFAHYPREQVLVLESGALRAPDGWRTVQAFLDIDDHPRPAPHDRNVGAYGPPPAAVVDRLRGYFAPHDERLFELLGARYDWA
jgi:hypothetical protein